MTIFVTPFSDGLGTLDPETTMRDPIPPQTRSRRSKMPKLVVRAHVAHTLLTVSAVEHRSPNRREKSRRLGFTIVELLVVVAMIGVLAALAMVGYRKYMNAAQASEAKSVLQAIRNAEEAYKSETLVYLGCSSSWTEVYPMTSKSSLSSKKWGWGSGPNDACWKTLNVVTDGPVKFGYSVQAGNPGTAIPSLSGTLQTVPNFPASPTDPWYVALATGDRDEDSVYSYAIASSFTGEIYAENESE